MLFVGTAPTGVQYWTGTTYVTAYPVGDPEGDCTPFDVALANRIYSYNIDDAAEYSVGIYAQQDSGGGAFVWADNNGWRTTEQLQNVDQDSGSFVDADRSCGGAPIQTDPYPAAPVE
jgi:hypothetical protein